MKNHCRHACSKGFNSWYQFIFMLLKRMISQSSWWGFTLCSTELKIFMTNSIRYAPWPSWCLAKTSLGHPCLPGSFKAENRKKRLYVKFNHSEKIPSFIPLPEAGKHSLTTAGDTALKKSASRNPTKIKYDTWLSNYFNI